ncbi:MULTISPECIES: hypothetical protein [Sphingobacterium]|uniref:Uncharacterized protein n=1 Tax=Sphingobacterium populi TaxID=1812824 RepID=A0ABW5UBA2_9SPHI|nr:hypothetical protein [Sphingobacterium sp. CFCC 11742]
MAIQILQHPPEVAFSRNPVVFELKTDSLISETGRPQVFDISLIVPPSVGSYFILSWNGADYIFVFQTEVFSKGFILPLTGDGDRTWQQNVMDVLKTNYYVDKDFGLSMPNETTIRFVSKHPSIKMGITLKPGLSNIVGSEQVSAIDKVYRPNFAIHLELWVNSTLVSSSIAEVDQSGSVKWDIQDYLTTILQATPPILPHLNDTTPLRDSRAIRSFFIRFAEMYGEPQRVQTIHNSETLRVALGGIDSDDSVNIREKYSNGLFRWLSNDVGSLHITQPQWVSILNIEEDRADVFVCMNVIYKDNLQRQFRKSIGTWSSNEKLTIPVGVPQWDPALMHDQDISHFSIWLESGDTPITTIYSQKVESRLLVNVTSLAFINSLGSLSTVWVYGKKESGYDIKRSDNTFVKSNNRQVHQTREMDIAARNTWKVNSGYRALTEIAAFRDFMLSGYKYIIIDDRYVPVTLNTDSIVDDVDGDNLKAIAFELLAANENRIWSK